MEVCSKDEWNPPQEKQAVGAASGGTATSLQQEEEKANKEDTTVPTEAQAVVAALVGTATPGQSEEEKADKEDAAVEPAQSAHAHTRTRLSATHG